MSVVPSQTTEPEAVVQSPRPVVVGTDGSYWGDAALLWAAEHAWRTDAELDVWMSDAGTAPADVPLDGGLSHVSRRYPMLPIRVHRSGSDAARQLEAASLDAGLLVVGHRGHRTGSFGLDALVLPLVDTAMCDTVVVRGKPAAVRGDNRRITALVSGSADDELVLRRAATMATTTRSALRVVHASPMPMTRDAALSTDHQFVLDHAEHLLGVLDPRLRYTLVVLRVQPHEAVTHFTDNDLLVVGTGDHIVHTGRCGSVTRSALHHSPCPVLVAHRPRAHQHPEVSRHVPDAPRRDVDEHAALVADRQVRSSV
jgi:nucleotide-binding universal stress UspA family protein